jgi:glycosyltransferase involved in cell wall biosynthesis
LSPDAGLSSDELNARRAASTGILRVVYAGRAHREKGIFDWIETLKLAHDEGVKFDATWFGDGPDLDAAIAAAKDLPGCIHFPGSVANHQELISKLKQFDLFLFCHKTPESPRCLVEALVCGLPLLGYDSPYPRDLISVHGGGVLTAPHRPSDLANILAGFPSNSRDLTERAIKDGADFNDESVFRHRSDLMRSIHKSYVERMSRVPQPHGNQ